ncbi:hypothetical protein SBK14_001818 [Providencia rettgeri]|nr:hypothetical protein [Providencia rettgeri]
MTVSTEVSSNEYVGNGLTTDFDYKFRIFKANQLIVITSDADGDNVVTLRFGTDYTVTGANKSAGGKVILTKPLANGHKISIARDIPIKQETSFRNQSKFLAETHEDAFDYLTMLMQRVWGSLGLFLKRPNILANWFDAKGYRIANLGKPKRDSDAVDLGTLNDEIEGVNSTILKQGKRLLRVDDMDISALPKANVRAGNVLTFDKDGKPIVVAPASGSAVDIFNRLSRIDGANLIGGAILECPSVAKAQEILGLTEGKKIRTYYYNTPVITDWMFTTTEPASPTFYINALGGYLVFMGPSTFVAAGLKPGNYVPADAWFNRNVMQGLMRDVRFSTFRVGFSGTYHILGSVCPLRSNIFLNVEEGVNIVGHYNDSSIPNSDVSQSGGLFSFVKYADPDNGDFAVVGTLSNINFILDGDVKTVYDATNSKPHNNNCFGFYDVTNCSVTGRGGISGSDHRGICFDGKSVNCQIDINYISGTSDEPIVMRGDKTKAGHTNTIRVNNISGLIFDGPAKGVVVNTAYNYYLDIWIGNYTGTSLPSVLVKNEDNLFTNVSVNFADNLTEVVRHYDAGSITINGGNFSNTISLVRRAGVGVKGICRDIVIKNIRILDDTLLYAFWAEINPDIFHALRIIGNDFSSTKSVIRLYQNRITSGRPVIEDFSNNEMPFGYAPDGSSVDPVLFNPLGRVSANMIMSEVSTFTYQYTGIYAFLSLQVRNTANNTLDQLEIDLIGMVQSNSSRTMATTAGNVTVARSINTITVTGATSVAFFYVFGHN